MTVVYLGNADTKLRRLHDLFFERARIAASAATAARIDRRDDQAARHQCAADLWDQAARDVRVLMMEKS